MKECSHCKYLDWDCAYAGEDYGDIEFPYCEISAGCACDTDENCNNFEEARELGWWHELWNELYGK